MQSLKVLIPLSTLIIGTALLLFWKLPNSNGSEILLYIRLPELLLAFSLGGLLGAGGAVFQGVLRNPLAEPYILGVSTGGALGATLSLFLKLPIEIGALVGSLSSVLLLVFASSFFTNSTSLLLFGIGLNIFFSSMVLLLYAILPHYSLQNAVYFLLGYLTPIPPARAIILFSLSIAGLLLLLTLSDWLDALSLGEEISFFSGITFNREGILLLTVISVLTAPFIAETGVVGFVGIVVPHIVRMLGFRLSFSLIPVAFLTGSSFLVLSQFIARNITDPTLLPVGVITSLLGVPLFLLILWRVNGTGG